jgi:hypothetical protein
MFKFIFKKITNKIFAITATKQSFIILIFGILVTLAIFYGFTNGFDGVDIAKEYHIIIIIIEK